MFLQRDQWRARSFDALDPIINDYESTCAGINYPCNIGYSDNVGTFIDPFRT